MKIIVMSDSHGDVHTIETILSLQADHFFHCGDSELPADHPLIAQLTVVKGNCDRDQRFPVALDIQIQKQKIWLVHGHEQDCKRTLLPLYYGALERQANIVLFGHSHIYGAEMREGILFINPGSTKLPRGGNQPTYAMIELFEQSITVSFFTTTHDLLQSAHFKIP